jgi:hypothetical protein
MRPVLVAALALAAASASAQPDARSTAVYADAIGPTGAYSLGVERAVWTASASERQLRLRAGAAYWTRKAFPDSPTEHVLTVPFGAVALFSLGRPVGVPAAFEFGAGAVFVRRGGAHFGTVGEDFGLPAYAEAAVRAALAERIGVRAGAAAGGAEADVSTANVRPVVGVTVGL